MPGSCPAFFLVPDIFRTHFLIAENAGLVFVFVNFEVDCVLTQATADWSDFFRFESWCFQSARLLPVFGGDGKAPSSMM
jgi:hypothetical protein